jgi:broad specificity phosphatase PhoE
MEGVVRILVARHPETEANVARRFVGRGDTPYTALGRRQADALVEAVSRFGPGTVFSSPRRRCLEVAERAATTMGAPVIATDDLAEIDFGEAEGLTYAEASELGISMDLLGGPSESAFAGGEPWSRFEARVRQALGDVTQAGPRVAIVTHSGPVRAMLTLMLELPAEAAWRFAIAPASVTLFTAGEDFAVLEGFGLEPDGVARD